MKGSGENSNGAIIGVPGLKGRGTDIIFEAGD